MQSLLQPAFVGTITIEAFVAYALIKAILALLRFTAATRRYNHQLLLRHERINRHHLRNDGGVALNALVCIAAGHALVLLLWAIATAFLSLHEPRW